MPSTLNRKSFSNPSSISKDTPKKNSMKNYDRQTYVLVIDDSEDVLKFMKIHLNRSFSHVLVSKKVLNSGIDMLKKHPVDVIIMALPQLTQQLDESLKRIGKQARDIPVILMDDKNALHEYWNSQIMVASIIKKPIEVDILRQAIDRALHMRPFLVSIGKSLDIKEDFSEFILKKDISQVQPALREKILQFRSQFF